MCTTFQDRLKDQKNVICLSPDKYRDKHTTKSVHDMIRKIQKHPGNENALVVVPVVLAGRASDLEKKLASEPLPDDIAQHCTKMIAATNIVETSITLERLVCVVDSGMFKEAIYDSTRGITVLSERCISEAQRGQRVGRVGRTMDGFAYTIDLESGKARQLQQRPEIQRTDLKQSVL